MDFTLQAQSRIDGGPAITMRGEIDYLTAPQPLDCLDLCLQPTPTTVRATVAHAPPISMRSRVTMDRTRSLPGGRDSRPAVSGIARRRLATGHVGCRPG
jgi:hypothetical protein